jgi:heptosyltransferase II
MAVAVITHNHINKPGSRPDPGFPIFYYMHKILVIFPAWIGDAVIADSLLKQLKKNLPNSIIHILAPTYLVPLIERMNEPDKIIPASLKHGKLDFCKRYKIGKMLRNEKFQQAIILPNSWKSALIPFFAKIPHRTGWRGEMRYGLLNDLRILDKKKLPLMMQRFVALGFSKEQQLPNKVPQPKLNISANANIDAALLKLNLTKPDKPIIALAIGASFGPAKRWPAQHFAELAQLIAKQGNNVWLFGGKEDAQIAAEIQQACNHVCTDLTGQTNLGEAIDLLSLAKAVVSNDSGLMHIAAALNLPLVALYGSSSPNFTPPLSYQAKILSIGLKCSPCFKRVCPLKHFRCMMNLSPKMVYKKLQEIIS